MKRRPLPNLLFVPGLLLLAALTLFAYRGLLARPFIADDYEWLLLVHGRTFGDVLRDAFNIGEQSHFFRPLIWLLFWFQSQLFGLEQRGYHVVSLGLHIANAWLTGALLWRITSKQVAWLRCGGGWLAAAIVALHPAPFEAITWISGQSDLLAALLLLLMLHAWLPTPVAGIRWQHGVVLLLLALALLTKESAVIGLPLLLLFGLAADGRLLVRPFSRWWPYLLPAALTGVYLVMQLVVEQRNYVVSSGLYGVGTQLILNPLRSLGLLVLPLAGTEHADNWWLPWLGCGVALLLAGVLFRAPWKLRMLTLALLVTLLPTAPFAAPPNSRYLYMPVVLGALLLACAVVTVAAPLRVMRRSRFPALLGGLLAASLIAWAAFGELPAREWRFASGAGSAGSLWQLMRTECAGPQLNRAIIVEPPLVHAHVEAIVKLACGDRPRPVIVDRAGVADALRGHSLVIAFPGGTATVEQRTD